MAYTLAMFAFYSLVPVILQWSGVAVLNLSLLTSNLWAALARALLLGMCQTKSPNHSMHRC
jgi:solute carrier family 35 protein F1/2